MTRDYKPQSRRSSSGSGRPLLTGIVIGLFLGLGIALAVVLYIQRTPSPFASREAPTAAPSPAAPAPVAPQAAAKPKEKPRFEFYDVLTRNEEPVTEQEAKAAQDAKPTAATPPVKETYFLQAGAFQNQGDAENLRARLALMGTESSIQTIQIPDKGTWHRVRLGPYAKVDDVSRVRQTLKTNGVDTTLIRVRDPVAH